MADPRGAEIAKLEALFSENPDGRVFTHLAEAYRRAGEPERARVLLEAGLERHADYASAHVVHGRVLLDLGLEAEAEAAFQRVLKLDPENLVALRALGDLARRAGRAAEALGYYEQLHLRDPSSDELEAIIGELREMVAPRPAEAADWGPADAGDGAGTTDGAEPGFAEGGAAAAEAAAYGAEEPGWSGAQEQAWSGVQEPAALEPEAPPAFEAEQPVALEAQEPGAVVAGWADEGTEASVEEPAPFAVGSESPGEGESAPVAEAKAPGAGEAGPEEPAGALEPTPAEAEPVDAVVDPEAIVAWHVRPSEDAEVLPPEASTEEPDAAAGAGAEVAAEEPPLALDELASVAATHDVLAAEAVDAPPEVPLDEELDLEIGSLADLPDATHSLLFKDEYTDPESEGIPIEAWAPLTDEEIAGAGVGADSDAGPGDLEAASGDLEAAPSEMEAGPTDWDASPDDLEAGHEGPEPAELELAGPAAVVEEAGAPSAAEPDVVVLEGPAGEEAAVPEPVFGPGDAGGEEAGLAVAEQAEAPVSEAGPPPEVAEPVAQIEPTDAAAAEPAEEAASAEEAAAAAPADEFAVQQEATAASTAEEPVGEAPAEAAAVELPSPAAAPAGLRSEAVERPESLGGEVVTETLADLYLVQGLFDRAVALYRRLLESQPGDARLEARLREAEARLAGAARAEEGGPAWEVVGSAETGVGAEQRVEDVEAVWTGGAGAGGQDVSPYAWPEEGEPASDAEAADGTTIGQYLDALLNWKPSRAQAPAGVALPAEPKAEASSGGDGADATRRESDDDDDDLEMFRAWLQSLKR